MKLPSSCLNSRIPDCGLFVGEGGRHCHHCRARGGAAGGRVLDMEHVVGKLDRLRRRRHTPVHVHQVHLHRRRILLHRRVHLRHHRDGYVVR